VIKAKKTEIKFMRECLYYKGVSEKGEKKRG
jgi:hypothetical protein